MRREPLLIPASALAAGICAAHYCFFRLTDLALPALALILLLGFTLLAPQGRRLRLAVACVCIALVGVATQVWHRQGAAPQLSTDDAETVILDGCVVNPPVFSPAREQFTLQLAPQASARISVGLKPDEQLPLRYGQMVEVSAKVRLPHNYQNPDGFDYTGYLANQRIYWSGSVKSIADIKTLPGHCGSGMVAWIYDIRTWALGRLTRLYPGDPRTAALLQAILLGETGAVERRWTSDFRLTGTYHALVISGQHISVLAFTLLLIFKLLHFRKFPALCLATLACWLYAFVSGMSSPVVRAAGGFTLFLAASYCFRKTRILNLLAAISIVYLLLEPDQLFDPSFQLSFLSAAAIAVFAIPFVQRFTEPIRASVKRFDQVNYDPQVQARAAQWRVEFRLIAESLQAWTNLSKAHSLLVVRYGVSAFAFIADLMIVSACVQFGLALPMVIYFHRLSVTGLSANIIVIPLLSLVVPLGFAAILSGWHLLALLTAFLLHLAELVAGWHVQFEPSWRIAAIPAGVSILFAISLGVLAFAIRRNLRWVALSFAASLALFFVICWQPWPPLLHPKYLELTAIDVGQGDSLLLAFPDGETMLVDAGGFPGMSRMARKPQIDIGEDVVSPYLWSRRIKHLDYVVLTHGHSDHMGGLAAICDNFHPKALWIGSEPRTEEWVKIQQRAAADRIAIVPMTNATAPISLGGVVIRVLAPSSDYVAGDAPQNNDSLVLEVTYGHRNILLTGDAERPVEDELVASGRLHAVTLLKVGHHGSKTSSSEDFLRQIRPEFAFISDGYKNQFHHPHPDVLERLKEQHTAVYRTDQRGLITFRTDGDKVEVEPYR